MQNRGLGVRRGSNNTFPANTRVVRGDDLIIGNMLFFNKGAPSARFRINPYVDLNVDTGKINVPDDLMEIIKRLDLNLDGKIDSGEKSIGVAGIELLDEGSSYVTTGNESSEIDLDKLDENLDNENDDD